ncbi:SIMPL domain-containing protein [Thermanaerothrix sp. 4228-RoL]|uniref:SIMPL domain-containing protein n=1 Tax=Thermanaerothrix solaris TaxID=3058434 RepID=A0ABU3NQX3_9CHLR|nr:SIMPL domain-containing protein [Thermanaerothrix sp. 4228-RoL]MDT8898457.1 SIMPL domain-containing protein [Thermanaerothrix sp. 4228-RoL]
MKKPLWFALLALAMVGLLAGCIQVPAASTPEQLRTLNVGGNGKVYVVPDLAYIYVGVRTEAEDVASALSKNNEQAQAIVNLLKERGVAEKDIQTSAFNVYPQQNIGPDGEVLGTKFVVENTVFITARDLSQLGSLLDAVVRVGANTIYGISFDVADRAKAEAEARRLAVEDAKARAQELAAAVGVTLGEVQNVSVYSSGSPIPVYEAKGMGIGGGGNAPIAAGQLVISADANITYLIR